MNGSLQKWKSTGPGRVLPVIVISQFCCTSLWFAGNGVMDDLLASFGLGTGALGYLTSAVQFGFITGTFLFAMFTLADRFLPTNLFLLCALAGALFNLGPLFEWNGIVSLAFSRFLTGFFLAGIYPVGMKIAADHFREGLGRSLGYLVGALVIGTGFPHLLKGFVGAMPWRMVLVMTSVLAVGGGLLMALTVPPGPYRRQAQKLEITSFLEVFRDAEFRSAAFGYFGHMWELYAFWAFIPVFLRTYAFGHPGTDFNVPVLSFIIMGAGGPACILGGYLSQVFGTRRVAATSLLLSCICCILTPFLFLIRSPQAVIGFLIFWGMAVIADSPLFSTLVANNAIPYLKGTALTIVNCLGFSITILSILVLNLLNTVFNPRYIFVILALGPALGLYSLQFGKKTGAPLHTAHREFYEEFF